MVGKNGRKVLKTKGFRHDRENGLNISKRFFSLHGLTSALRLRGFSSDIRGIAYIGFADGAKTAWKGFIFGCVAVFMAGLMDFVI